MVIFWFGLIVDSFAHLFEFSLGLNDDLLHLLLKGYLLFNDFFFLAGLLLLRRFASDCFLRGQLPIQNPFELEHLLKLSVLFGCSLTVESDQHIDDLLAGLFHPNNKFESKAVDKHRFANIQSLFEE